MSELFNIKKGDIISIVGAGGKTSLLFDLADKLSKKGSVLITTTTKIYKPVENDNFIFIYPEEMENLSPQDNFIHIYCSKIIENKIHGASFDEINFLKNRFDYILIEADGSAGKPLKGWKNNEPVIFKDTTKTIAVIDITALGLLKNEQSIHRFKLFKEQFQYSNKTIEKNDYIGYINSNTFFKNSFGEKILFFNKIENLNLFESFYNIVNSIEDNFNIYFGSIFKNEFFHLKKITPIILASGFSKRFNGDKLSFILENKISILEKTLINISKINFRKKIIVGKNNFHKELSEKYNFEFVYNNSPDLGQSYSIYLGVSNYKTSSYIFIPGDMPFLTKDTILRLIYEFQKYNEIIVPFINGERSAPVIFPDRYYNSLISLKGDTGGREILKENIFIKCNFKNSLEFFDIDTQNDLKKLETNEILEEQL